MEGRGTRRPAKVVLALLGAITALVAGGWLAALWVPTTPGPDVLPLPAPGEAVGHVLSDGTHVWVTRTTGDEVFVVEAVHPDSAPIGLHTSATHAILCDEPLLESRWASRFLADGTNVAGPAGQDLRRYEIESIDDGRVTVGPIRPVTGSGRRTQTNIPWERVPWCPTDARFVPHPEWAEGFDEWHRRWYADFP